MKNWEDDDDDEYCSTREDLVDAAAVADVHRHRARGGQLRRRVQGPRVRRASCASTRPAARPTPTCCATPRSSSRPSSTTRCALGAEQHRHRALRARAQNATAASSCSKGTDRAKDQSYFLHRLNQAQLSRVLFPVGELKKTEVRRIAREAGLPNHAKKDSTGICFIGERPFREFLNRYLPSEPGPIVTPEGKRVGEHIGLAFYTIGQREGHRHRRQRSSAADAVVRGGEATWPRTTLMVVQGHDHPLLMKSTLQARGCELGGRTRLRDGESHFRRRRATGRPTRPAR